MTSNGIQTYYEYGDMLIDMTSNGIQTYHVLLYSLAYSLAYSE